MRPKLQVFVLVDDFGDRILAMGETPALAMESARSALGLDEAHELYLFDETGDAVEALNSEYGGACYLTTESGR